MEEKDNTAIKCVLVGDCQIGKTCIILSYTTDSFQTDYIPTVFDNFSAVVTIEGRSVMLGLWDSPGHEEYHLLRPLSYSNCDICFLCFSVVDPPSYEHAVSKWAQELKQYAPQALKILVGNKIDLREEYANKEKNNNNARNLTISYETASKAAAGMKCKYFECSALTQEGLKEVFDEAIKLVVKKRAEKATVRKTKSGCNLIQ